MTTETDPKIEELIAKVNSITDELKAANEARVKAEQKALFVEKIAKINAISPQFKADASMSADFLDGVKWAYEHPLPAAEKANSVLPPTPTTGSPRKYHTPDGKEPGEKPLTVRVGFENEPVEGF